MPMGYASGTGFPWLAGVIVMALVMMAVAAAAFLLWRRTFSPRDKGSLPAPKTSGPVLEPPTDPMVALRDRLVRGEIELPEYEVRLEALLRSDPAERMPWWGNAASAADLKRPGPAERRRVS